IQPTMYAKTALAWQALSRPDQLERRAHTLLLMANGRRTLRELSRLLDQDATALARRLADQGYLQHVMVTATAEVDEEAAG
ncbi:hypothetical protein, partial [Salmonella enterica]|uniref:hypothetical protein n=1 Tax=Salmonella enterica TaxID=28901 RepID=UPI003F4BF69F